MTLMERVRLAGEADVGISLSGDECRQLRIEVLARYENWRAEAMAARNLLEADGLPVGIPGWYCDHDELKTYVEERLLDCYAAARAANGEE